MQEEASTGPSPSPTSLATMTAFNHVYNIKEYFYISPAPVEHQNKVCPAHNNVNSVRINKVNLGNYFKQKKNEI